MDTLAMLVGTFLGGCVAWAAVRWSMHVLRQFGAEQRPIPVLLVVVLVGLGSATGFIVGKNPATTSISLAVMTVLLVVQTPVDLSVHHLLRTPTLISLAVLIAVQLTDVSDAGWADTYVLPVILTTGVVGAFSVLHAASSQSIGWGDVLLVAPIAYSVSLVEPRNVGVWLLLSTASAAAHGIWVRVRHGGRHIPFGPHLLLGAWVVLVTGV